jgi:import receptor subunit TOM22
VWIVTTSALLVGLPLALAVEDEAKVVAQDQEILAQQQGAQQVRSILDSIAFRLTDTHQICLQTIFFR